MSSRTVVEFEDDLTGAVIPDGEGQTVFFTYKNQNWAIDLGRDNVEQFDADMKPWITAARPAGNQTPAIKQKRKYTKGGVVPDHDAEERKRIRQWARENGHEVGDRARISQKVIDAYNAAMS